MAIVTAVAIVLRLLGVVLELAAEHSACDGTKNAVATHLVATKVTGSTATKSAHQATVTLLLHSWVAVAVLLPGLAVGILALWVLVLTIGALLRELVLRLGARISSLLILAVLPLLLVVVVTSLLLAMLEAALCGRAVLGVVALLLPVTLLAVGLLLLLLLVTLLLVATLVVATLLLLAVALLWVLLLLAVALVVLAVAGHGDESRK